ncbi:histone-like nucleoid-structuring protein Lsr2 [Nesterenkonia ebinurensis]|uniref:histone-like nucleoid-structuring protein Lsr2 n=1 Tax=Nesterenkonia ebinurensis TaxID=2608252 RepID=UPI00123D4FB9|nr:Lsr2 family protein [Nesterenkonia ebinurensis]
MAKQIQEILVDDLDGSPAKETVNFGLDNRFYAIDLSSENAKELRDSLKKYVRKATPVAPPSPQSEARKIREWAVANGYSVAKRGRLHRDIVDAYRNAKKR